MPMALDLIRDYKPELIKMMKAVLNDQESQMKLDLYEASLNGLISRIHASEARNMQLGQKYSKLLNELYLNTPEGNLNALRAMESSSSSLNAELQGIINELFQKEHEILDYLTQGLAATNSYAIYFSTESGGSEVVMRGEISAKDLYDSGKLTIGMQGITLQHHNVVELFQTKGNAQQLTPEQIEKYSQIAQSAISSMQDAFAQLKKELGELQGRKAHEHLGDVLWKKYQKLKRLVGNEYQIEGLYASYMYGNITSADHRTGLRGAFMNRGHIYEALERYVQGDDRAPSELLGDSIGHDPWWTQGDVGTIQVKSLVGSQERYQSFVKVASMSSILQVASMLQTLLRSRRKQNQELDAKLDAVFEAQIASGADHSGEMIDKIIQDLIAQLPGAG